MTFLPIVQRELRAAARRKSTYRIRWWTTVIALVMTFFAFLFASLTTGGVGLGQPLFSFLTGYALCLSLLAGALLAADCLSEEKREGTLGLLFLTDLKGYDVVLGKLMAASLNAFYALLALLPVTALPLLLGGVTGAEFWRTALALVNTLFFALAAGMCTSAFARDGSRAVRNALGLLLLLAVLLPLLARTGARAGISPGWLYPVRISPIYSFAYARDALYLGHPGRFWGGLAVSLLAGWLFLALASCALPRLWQEKTAAAASSAALTRWWRRGRGNPAKRAKARAHRLAVNPVFWLITRGPDVRRVVWVVVVLWAIVAVTFPLETLFLPAKLCELVLKLLLAFQACRFFVEARRTGALELLLCTPLRSWDMVRGQWLAIRRAFLGPVIVVVLLSFIPFGVKVASMLHGPGLGQIWLAIVSSAAMLITIAWFTLGFVMDIVALAWVGMWLALSMKKPAFAPLMTVLLALVTSFLFPFCILNIPLDLGLLLWSLTKLQQDFRWVLGRQYAPALIHLPPRRPVPIPGVPPLIHPGPGG